MSEKDAPIVNEIFNQLIETMGRLTPAQQHEVLNYANYLLQKSSNKQEVLFYICPDSFEIYEEPGKNHHGNPFVPCFAATVDADLRPVTDEQGNLKSRAPRWYLKAVGLIED